MPRFFFHLSSPEGRSQDHDGTEFATVEDAFLDVHRAVLDISLEMLLIRRDPHCHLFDVRDEAGFPLFELPFSEVLRPSLMPRPFASPQLTEAIETGLQRNRTLKGEIALQIAIARESLERMLQVLRGSPTADDR